MRQTRTSKPNPKLLGLGSARVWDTERAFRHLKAKGQVDTKRTAERKLNALALLPAELKPESLEDELGRKPIPAVLNWEIEQARGKRKLVLFAQLFPLPGGNDCLHANDARGARYWLPLAAATARQEHIGPALHKLQLHLGKDDAIFPHGRLVGLCRQTAAPARVGLSLLSYPATLTLEQMPLPHPPLQGALPAASGSRSSSGQHAARNPRLAPSPLPPGRERGKSYSHPPVGAQADRFSPSPPTGERAGGSPKGGTTRRGGVRGRATATLLRKDAIRSRTPTPHLKRLEAESIYIIREAVAEAENPVMLYSVGKDSSVMLQLARKAFYPSPPPFPLLHVDTRWKFQEMYLFRDAMARASGMDLLVHINPEAIARDINPFDHGSVLHTDITKTEGLKQALDKYKFDVVFGGARRDEEKSRAKERIFSFRTQTHRWDPKNQRPELWNLYNTRKSQGESIRVFPLSNWTELDVWQYIHQESIPVVPLYFAKERPVVLREGLILLVDDARMRLRPGEKIEAKKIRFRTLGCYPLTGAIESDAADLPGIILELVNARSSERQGRAIDSDAAASMEKKKQEGYF